MASARRVWALQLAVALLGAAATLAALLVAVSRIDFNAPSPGELAAACQRYALPDLRPASVLVLALGSVALATLVLSLRAVVRQLRAGRRFERGLVLLGPVPGVARAYAVDDDEPQAFCIGLLRPRIYVTRAALELLGDDEGAAVLAHEAHHARRRDPLRLLVARALAEGLFFLPASGAYTSATPRSPSWPPTRARPPGAAGARRLPRRCWPSTSTRARRRSASRPSGSSTFSVGAPAGNCRRCCCSAPSRPSAR